ncbi:hypothetical protein NDU88_002048 [Pleurodeles waltl]|uniref:Uncharacterized protein n=1 Tax=Pleurodeles waltl TaxID=8319 RepID=A0AAV7RED6_PLEWA|nr:hypothetical protein NDU88_002048 [Pleurodeles waltl]
MGDNPLEVTLLALEAHGLPGTVGPEERICHTHYLPQLTQRNRAYKRLTAPSLPQIGTAAGGAAQMGMTVKDSWLRVLS